MLLHEELSNKIIASFFKVYNTMGYGFLEKVYENSLFHELTSQNINAVKQFPIEVYYNKIKVGQYFAYIMADGKIIIEIKAAEGIAEEHELQLINYLKATNIEIGLLLNFGKKPEFRRKIFTNDRKQSV
jgi:GxxExxY protein